MLAQGVVDEGLIVAATCAIHYGLKTAMRAAAFNAFDFLPVSSMRQMTRGSVFEFQCLGHFCNVVSMLLASRPRYGCLLNLRSLGLGYQAISF